MTTPSHCPTCQAPLPESGPLATLCAACLFGSARAPEQPAAARAPLDLDELRPHFLDLDLECTIGRGGMGVVLRARQRRLDRPVALKLLAPNVADDPDFAQRFEREARALARLSHQNIVGVHDFGEAGGHFYLLMEFVEGASLRDLIRDGRLTPQRVLHLVPQICTGLQFAHEQGVVHRDIKPENVLVDTHDNVRIADFGLAKLVGRDDFGMTRASEVMGTPGYMAPEQLSRPLGVDHRADVFAVGVLLYEMLTGEVPHGRFAPPSEKVPIDPRLDQIVLRAMAEEAEDRYQSARALQDELDAVAGRTPVSGITAATSRIALAPLDARDEAFAVTGELSWFGALPMGALPIVCISVLGACVGLILSGQARNVTQDWYTLAYPFAYLGIVALRSEPLRRADMATRWGIAFASFGGAIASAVMASMPRPADPVDIVGQVFACSMLFAAHVLLERWIRRCDWLHFVLAAAVVGVAATMHGSIDSRGARLAWYFSVGMSGALCGASLVGMLPELALGDIGPRLRAAMMRATLLGSGLGVLYVWPHLFG